MQRSRKTSNPISEAPRQGASLTGLGSSDGSANDNHQSVSEPHPRMPIILSELSVFGQNFRLVRLVRLRAPLPGCPLHRHRSSAKRRPMYSAPPLPLSTPCGSLSRAPPLSTETTMGWIDESSVTSYETVARRRSAALLSEFGLGHVREYAPFDLILSALHLIHRATFSICVTPRNRWG